MAGLSFLILIVRGGFHVIERILSIPLQNPAVINLDHVSRIALSYLRYGPYGQHRQSVPV